MSRIVNRPMLMDRSIFGEFANEKNAIVFVSNCRAPYAFGLTSELNCSFPYGAVEEKRDCRVIDGRKFALNCVKLGGISFSRRLMVEDEVQCPPSPLLVNLYTNFQPGPPLGYKAY